MHVVIFPEVVSVEEADGIATDVGCAYRSRLPGSGGTDLGFCYWMVEDSFPRLLVCRMEGPEQKEFVYRQGDKECNLPPGIREWLDLADGSRTELSLGECLFTCSLAGREKAVYYRSLKIVDVWTDSKGPEALPEDSVRFGRGEE